MFMVYKLTFASGKSYIGQTSRKMITRITQHRQSARTGSLLPVHCAWRLHGEPDVMVLSEVGTQEELHMAEIAAIASFNTASPFGYNLSAGGDTAPSKNPEVAAKIAKKAVGRRATDEVKARIGAASKRHWEDDTYREKVTAAVEKSWTPELRAKRSEITKAAWAKRKAEGWTTVPESTREKLRGRVFSDESRAKMSSSAKGKPKAPRSEATCKKLAASTAKSWSDPELKKTRSLAISNALKERHANLTEVEKRELSEIRKRAWATRKSKISNE